MATATPRRGPRAVGRLYLILAAVVLLVLLQSTLLARVRFAGAMPNLLLVVVVIWSLLRGAGEGMVWAFAGGLLFDAISGLPLGASSLALMLASLLPGISEGKVFHNNLLLPLILVAVATPLYAYTVLAILGFRGVPVQWLSMTLWVMMPEMALNLASVAILYPLLRRLSAWQQLPGSFS